MVLVIGYRADGAIRHTLERFAQMGVVHDFLDLTLFSTSRVIEVRRAGAGLFFRFDDSHFDLLDYRSIYHRTRFQALEDRTRTHLLRKGIDNLYAFLNHSPQMVVNRPSAGTGNHNKFLHLEALREFGFTTPEQMILGDQETAAQIIPSDGSWVNKGCSAFKTSAAVHNKDLASRLELLRTCPSLFQEKITGKDVRIHVVGGELYALSIECGSLDYRFTESGEKPSFSPTDAPGTVKLQCLEFARRCQLPFAGFDFKVCRNTGTWFVLEMNPMPGYDMFDRHLGGRISAALAEFLCSAGLAEPARLSSP